MADQNLNNMTVTWNSGGTTFAAVKMNVTDTASAAASLLLQLQVGGSDKFKVGKDGTITGAGNLVLTGNATITGNVTISGTLTAAGIVGTVTGPVSSTDNAIARFNGTTGGVLQNSGVIIDDNNIVTIPGIGDTDKFGQLVVSNPAGISDGRYTSIVIGKAQAANEAAHIGYYYDTTAGDRGVWIVNYSDSSLSGGIFVRSGGNVGIGTSSPASKLVVQGNTDINGALTATGAVSGTTGTFSGAVTSSQNFSSSTAVAVLAATGAGQVLLRPNGAGSATGQMVISTAGAATINGALTATTGTFSGAVSGTTGTFSGAVSGTTGAFSSTVTGTFVIASSNIFATSAAATMSLRPNGAGSTTGQMTIGASGAVIADGTVSATRFLENNIPVYGAPFCVLEDQKPQNTGGGTFTQGAWRTRTLNTKVRDPDGLVTLSADTFVSTVNGWAEFDAIYRSTGVAQLRLFNVTDGTVAGYGLSDASGTNGAPVTAGKTYRLEHQITISGTFGNPVNVGPEVYARVRLWRV